MKKIILFLTLILNTVLSQAVTYYVKTGGNDSSSGLSDALAWATLSKVNSFTFTEGDQILFNKGNEFYGSLTINQSGTLTNKITYGAYGTGTNPIITGFTTISSWTDLGSNIWESTSAVSTLSTVNIVSIAGVNTTMGRIPNTGYYPFQSHSGSISLTSSDLTGTPNWTGAEVVVRTNDFKIDRRIITSQSSGTLNWTTALSYAPTDGFGFFIQNDERTLDSQNEWYYNPSTKKIKIYSVGQQVDVKVPSIDNLCNINSNYIVVDGIDFKGANIYGITSTSTTRRTNITIKNCTIKYCGKGAISGINSSPFLIDGNIIQDCNNSGISNGGSDHMTITNNTISNIGILAGMTNSLWGAISVPSYSLIQYNRLTNIGYHGINYKGDSIFIKNNIIDTFCTTLHDGGAIYSFTGTSLPENSNIVIDGNIILNGVGAASGTNSANNKAMGIYFDYNSTASEVKNNTIYNCSHSGIYLGFDVNNLNIHANTVFDCTAQIKADDYESVGIRLNTINSNRFIAKLSTQKVIDYYSVSTRIPTFATSNNNFYARPIDDVLTMRYGQTGVGQSNRTIAQWQAFSLQDANSFGSPKAISDVNDLQFYYNDTQSDSIISLTYRSIDVSGSVYSSNITLHPFESIVLIKDVVTSDYYVSTSGNDSNNGSIDTPWLTLYHACASVTTPNSIIHVASGTYTEIATSILVPGVSIIGAGITTVIKSSLSADWIPILKMNSVEGINGNQSISNLKFDGQILTTAWAIECRGRSNVSIHDCMFIDFRQYGVWLGGRNDDNSEIPTIYATGNRFYNNIVTNCASMSGENGKGCLNIGGQDGMLIYNNTITNNLRTNGINGYPIKYANSGYNKGLKIYDNTLTADKKIAGGLAFAIELWRSQGGIEIYNNTIKGSIDIATTIKGDYLFGVDIHHNTIGYPSFLNNSIETAIIIEGDINSVNIHHNLVSHCAVGVMCVYNQNMISFQDVSIYYNIFKKLGTTAATWNTFGISATGSDANITGSNFFILNNVIEADQTIGAAPYFGVNVPRVGSFTNCQIKNNIIIGFNTAIESSFTSTLDVLNISNNITFGNSNNISVTTFPTNYINIGNLTSNPLFIYGTYRIKYQSPARNLGINVGLLTDFDGKLVMPTPSIGAYEFYNNINNYKKTLLNSIGKPLLDPNGFPLVIP